ncbi:ROK family protein [Motilibacter rhizosphaerae]|uniref:ROK family protein n=1 Tax=Motilibacter rhizosphaerae TaxID=598652 RepID=UPI00102D1515|nr:ROK family transcriptional regulator [Motilibacter rhizosphaerae]
MSSYNRNLVLDTVRSYGVLSRVELAAMTGLTGATMSRIVRVLLDDGLLMETGKGESTGGKPRTLLRIDPTGRYAVGVQVSAASTTVVVTDLVGAVVRRQVLRQGSQREPATVIAATGASVEKVLASADVPRERVAGVGVAFPGLVDADTGTVLAQGGVPGWAGVPLADPLVRGLGLPVLVDNDATAAAIGERWVGSAATASSFGVVFVSDGIGSGLFLDGRPYRGAANQAGELAHVVVHPGGLGCFCGKRGCLNGYTAPHAVVLAARAHQEGHAGCALDLPPGSSSVRQDYDRLARAYAAGVSCALRLLDASAEALSVAMSNLVEMLDLELVVLAGGGFGRMERLHLDAVQAAVGARAEQATTRVLLSPIASDAAAVGAAALVLHREFGARMLGLMS